MRSIGATVDADVVQVLAGSQEEVTGNQLAGLAGRSYARVYAVVRRMAAEGLVDTIRHGRTNTYRLNPDHVLAHAIGRLLSAPGRIESEIRQTVATWRPTPATVAFLGPTAQRRAGGCDALDVLVLRPASIGRLDSGWRTNVTSLNHRLEALSGNPVHIVEIDERSIRQAATDAPPLVGLLRIGLRTSFGERPVVWRYVPLLRMDQR